MTHFFRMAERHLWIEDAPSWLAADDAVGNQIGDLSYRMQDNTVSVYALPDLEPATLLRVAAAVLATKGKLVDIGYCILDDALIARIPASLVKTPGTTGDAVVDDWHHDLVNMSGKLLTRLATEIRELDHDVVLRDDVANELVAAIEVERRFAHRPQIASALKKEGFLKT